LLDNAGRQILTALQEDARLSFVELGKRAGLSPPAVAERVRRMEEAGIITGYRVEVSCQAVGVPITAFIRVQTTSKQYPALVSLVENLPEARECHHLAGADAFIIKVVAGSISHLEALIGRVSGFGPTTTSIVLSSPVTGQPLTQLAVKGNEHS